MLWWVVLISSHHSCVCLWHSAFCIGVKLKRRKQTVTNLVENVNDASRKKQSINSAPSMCCEEKKEHFSPSSEHRHVSSHRVAYWFCPNQTLLHSRISHIQIKGIVNWILNMGQSYSNAWLWLSSYIQIGWFWICLCIVKVIFRF